MALQPLQVGPWTGVRDTEDPFDDNPNQLVDALNCYIPDPQGQSGLYARPGFTLGNSGTQFGVTGHSAPGVWCYTSLSGTIYNFLACGGALYRSADGGGSWTNVTPTNVTIDSGSTTRVAMLTFADQLIVSDGVNKPWIGSSLGSTPITATNIEYTTAATSFLRGTTDTKLGSIVIPYQIPGSAATTLGANAVGTTMPAGTVPASTWAIWRVSVHSTPSLVFTSAANNYTTGYASEALAIAALPATPTGDWNAGYVTLLASASTWIGQTDALAGGASGNPATTTNYYAGDAPPWCAFGIPVNYFGALMFIANTLSAVSQRTTVLWSEPNQPSLGYEQTGYADFFNAIQDSPEPIYALGATNFALYFWRPYTIGVLSGAPNTFTSTATHDLVSQNVGTQAPFAVAQFSDTFYFVDREGRPWKFTPGTALEPIWLQMRQQWDDNTAGAAYPGVTQYTATGAIQPELNLYVVAIWSPSPGALARPIDCYIFDANTGTYSGRWQVTVTTGIGICAIGAIRDGQSNAKLAIIGNNAAGGGGGLGYLWIQSALTDANWKDNSVVPQISATTSRLGYASDVTWTARNATLVTMSNASCTVTVQTPYTSSTTEATALSPGTSLDGTYRIPLGLDVRAARGMQFTVVPTTATSQWGLQRIVVTAVPRRATIYDL